MTISSRLKLSGLVLAIVLAASTAAHALSIAEQRVYDKWVADLNASSQITSIQSACGVAMPVKLDQALATPFIAEDTSAMAYCDDALYALPIVCGDAAGKKAVAEKIHSVSCTYNSTPGGLTMSIANGELQVSFGIKASNIHDKVKKYLENNL